MLQSKLLKQLVSLEQSIAYFDPPPNGTDPFTWTNGRIPILISAPHATAHYRQGRMKGEEEYTAALTKLLAQETKAYALYTRYRSQDDPNWDRMTPYKASLQHLIARHNIRFVIDLHGMSNRHNFGIAVGTMNGRSCPNRELLIANTLEAHQFVSTTEHKVNNYGSLQWGQFVFNHSRFTGGVVNHTITRFVAETLGIDAVQIELCSSLRIVQREHHFMPSFTGSAQGIARTYRTLAELIRTLAARLY